MRLGFNSNGLQSHRLDDGLRLLADHGYQHVALTPDICHLDPYRATPSEVDATAALCSRLGLSVSIETGARYLLDPRRKHEPTLMTRGEEARLCRLDYLERSARIGADLGAGLLSFWAGVDHRPAPDSAAWLREGVLRVGEIVRTQGLCPSFEPEPGMAVATMAEFEALRQDCGDQAPALTLDVGHLYVTLEADPVELCHRWADSCRQVHLEDMRRGIHEHLEPGEGEVDFRAVLRALSEGGYDGPICFELSRSSHRAVPAVELCAELWGRESKGLGL